MHARYAFCNPISGAGRRAARIEKSQEESQRIKYNMHFATPFLEPGEEPKGSNRAKRRAKGIKYNACQVCTLQPHFWSQEKSRKDRKEPRVHASYSTL